MLEQGKSVKAWDNLSEEKQKKLILLIEFVSSLPFVTAEEAAKQWGDESLNVQLAIAIVRVFLPVSENDTEENEQELPVFTALLVHNATLLHPSVKAKDSEAAREAFLKQYPGATIHEIK